MKTLKGTFERCRSYLNICKENFKSYLDSYNTKYGFLDSFFWIILTSLALFVIDYMNMISILLNNYDFSLNRTVGFFIIMLIVFIILKFGIYKMIRHPLINRIDKSLMIILGALITIQVLGLTNYPNMTDFYPYNKYLIWVGALGVCFRVWIIGKKDENSLSVIVDLKDISEGKINFNQMFIIRESEVEYDLLSRGLMIEDLVNWISNYQSTERFVIGVEGKWGSGKSTLIKNVLNRIKSEQKNREFIIIDEFEPWVSENKFALLDNLFKKILTHAQLDIPDEEIENVISSISKLVLGERYLSMVSMFRKKSDDEKAKQTIIEINKILKLNNSKIIIVIDNLDRLPPENVLMILNIVHNLLDFSNLVVILSYDKDELEKGLESINISKKYLDKLVQKKVTVPLINRNSLLQIFNDTIVALAKGKQVHISDQSGIEAFLRILVENDIGIREYKRFLNSSIIPMFNRNKINSLLDTLVIEFIRFRDFELYSEIYNNSDYFISTDRPFGSKISQLDEAKLDELLNIYFEKLSSGRQSEFKILALAFPNVQNFEYGTRKNYKGIINGNSRDDKYVGIQMNKRVASAKFFDLYFTSNKNYESTVVDEVIKFIDDFENDTTALQSFINSISEKTAEVQTDFFIQLNYHLSKLSREKLRILFLEILNSYFKFGDSRGFLTLGTRDRIAIVASEILENEELTLFKSIVHPYVENPMYLSVISNISYWLEKSHTANNSDKVSYLKQSRTELVNRIVNGDTINLYSENNYIKRNAIQLFFTLEENQEEIKFKEYVNRNLNVETVYRVLNDMITSSTGNHGYSYGIVNDIYKYVDVGILTRLLEEVPPKNERQEFIKSVFETYLHKKTNFYGEVEIVRSQPMKLDSID